MEEFLRYKDLIKETVIAVSPINIQKLKQFTAGHMKSISQEFYKIITDFLVEIQILDVHEESLSASITLEPVK